MVFTRQYAPAPITHTHRFRFFGRRTQVPVRNVTNDVVVATEDHLPLRCESIRCFDNPGKTQYESSESRFD
jgi:hypothetical protein